LYQHFFAEGKELTPFHIQSHWKTGDVWELKMIIDQDSDGNWKKQTQIKTQGSKAEELEK